MKPNASLKSRKVNCRVMASRMGYVRATEIAAFIGQGVAFALGFVGLFANPMLIFIAIFVYLAASSEAHLVAIRAMSRGVPTSAAMMTQFATLAPEAHVEDAGGRLVGLVTSETVGEMLMLHEALPAGARFGPWTRLTGA